ncbi:MAG: 50S ribosomal protein L37ae [Candidatus Woesearchaeota archaeon]
MARSKKVASGKRFGSRYGRRNRDRFALLEAQARKKHVCPSCGYEQAKRVAAGIWSCKKCSAKFASKAYTVTKFPTLKQKLEEDF